jgi:cellulose synthase/poly-beta-1,6-N-acetylglucosamine synthase-like glycosyltransferase/peptidoglycan/xylan/chitin deacetylase (PgdA/CDA1 family)
MIGLATTLAVVAALAFGASLAISHAPDAATGGPISALLSVNPPTLAPPHILMNTANLLALELHDRELDLNRVVVSGRPLIAAVGQSQAPMPKPAGRPLSIGFYVNWDDNSFPALQRALPHLDWVVPAWLSLIGPDMELKTDVDIKALDYINLTRPGIPVLPLIQNAVDDSWDGAGLAKVLGNPQLRGERIRQIIEVVRANKFDGVTIDFEEVPTEAHKDLQSFLREMGAAFKPLSLSLALAVPYDDNDWDYKAYASIADYLILMAYDQHWAQGQAGSIAAQDWFETTLDKRMAELDPAHTIVAIGNYGYDWVKGQTATDLTFADAMRAAGESQAAIEFDPDSNNPHFSYVEDDGKTHNVWFLDAVTAYNQVHAANIYRPAGYALWRLGSEDPSIWSILGQSYSATAPDAIKTIEPGPDINFEGQGEILRVASRPTSGTRTIEIDPKTGDIDDQTYIKLPTSYAVQSLKPAPHKVALTFDDGPDPLWTPQVLDILKQKNAVATFFMIGQNAAANPDLVRRVVDAGNEIGNHTYTHPNISAVPAAIGRLELNATQRLIEALTGRSMRLFRPPYLGDSQPSTATEVAPIDLAQSMGYLTVGLKVDPDDWQRPPADAIVARVLQGVSDANPEVRGQIVLLHDSGGDRSQTIIALPKLIDALREKGLELVTVSELAGLTRDQGMPPLPAGALASFVDVPAFMTINAAGAALGTLFQAAIWLGLARLGFLSIFGFINLRQDKRRAVPMPAVAALVSVLIPAHNESKVIMTSISRVLSGDYPNLEVIVIDDGSVDGTASVVRAGFAHEPSVILLSIPNIGKAGALNRGLALAKGGIVVALDADTQFEPTTISRLARWFAFPRIGAVAGNAKVGNRINLATRWQALEYISAQNLERRALAALGCVTVVPGAVGAWRRSALDEVGGFSTDTLAEDQDLTIALQKAGHGVLFDSEAIAWTEAPATFRGLSRQRFRWAYGTLQCLQKHRVVMLNPRYGSLGLVAFPQVALFQILFSLLSPFVDLLFLSQLLWTGMDYLQHKDQFVPDNLIRTGLFFAVFMLVDAGAAILAFAFEKHEEWRLLLWLPLQRFGYRQIMYYVVVKSVLKALMGPHVGWGKLDRTGAVTLLTHPDLSSTASSPVEMPVP